MTTLLDAPATGRRPCAAPGPLAAPAAGAAAVATDAPVFRPAAPLADRAADGAGDRAATLGRLERALYVLLAPLDAPDFAAWRAELHAALLSLFEAESVSLYLPVRAEADAEAPASALDDWYAPHVEPEAALALFGELLPGADGEADLLTTAERAIPYNEFVRPDRLRDATLVRVPFGGAAEARVWIVGGPGATPASERIALVRAVVPALRAGLATWAQVAQHRAALTRLLDSGAGCALAFDARGRALHESPACARLLADEPAAEAARLREAARVLALGVAHARTPAGAGDAPALVRTARHRYELAATRSATPPARESVVVVALRRREAAPLDDAALRERYALTRREIEVARLLAEGLSNTEVAARMGVSFFTARNHVERLLRKLGASNRARVGAMLRDAE